MKTTIVLLSGGQDSTTCLLATLAMPNVNPSDILALAFDYGQKHKVELGFAETNAKKLGVDFKVMDIKGLLGGSSLTDHEIDSNEAHSVNSALPASFTAGRNALFLTIAGAYGYGIGANTIVTGVCQTDYSGYPDCRQDFITSQRETLQLAMDNPKFSIKTPLMYLTKAETWKLAKDAGETLGIDGVAFIKERTLTDYNGDMTPNEWGFGKLDNPASELRAKGYYEAVELGLI